MKNKDVLLINGCFKIACRAHCNQFRRGGAPYISHPKAVYAKVQELGVAYACVALLHDVLEESAITDKDLQASSIPQDIVDAVVLLTKKPGVEYRNYLGEIKKNELARTVKIADMLHNLSDDPSKNQIRKYAMGLLFLIDGE